MKKLTKLSEIQRYVKEWIEKVGERDWTKWNLVILTELL